VIHLQLYGHDRCNIAYGVLWPITENWDLRLMLFFDLLFLISRSRAQCLLLNNLFEQHERLNFIVA